MAFFPKLNIITSEKHMALKEVTESTFEAEVLQSPIPVLVDFWATWCGTCKMMMPAVEQVAATLAGEAKVVKVDAGSPAGQALAIRYNVRSLPTLIVFKNGEATNSITGMTTKDKLIAAVRA